MNKNSENDELQNAYDQSSHAQFSWQTFVMLWLFSLFLLLGASDYLPSETVSVLDARHDVALLGSTQWTVPVLHWKSIVLLTEIPCWLFAMIGSVLIASVGLRHLHTMPVPLLLLGMGGLSLMMQPEHLISGGIIWGFIYASERTSTRSEKLFALVGGLVASVLLSIEFGYLASYFLLLLFPVMFQQGTRKSRIFIVIVGAILLAIASQFSGFIDVAMRPVNWIFTLDLIKLLPSMRSLFDSGIMTFGNVFLILFLGFCLLNSVVLKTNSERGSYHFPLLLIPLAVACSHFLWVCVYSIAAGIKFEKSSAVLAENRNRYLWGSLLVGGLFFVANAEVSTLFFVSSDYSGRFIDPAKWECRGRVLLMDLEQSNDWQTQSLQKKFTLILDDRWESCGSFYREYAGFCRDLNEGRSDSYLLSDGSWGGYKRELKSWKPSLLVTRSDNLLEIRRLSLNPHWSLLGIDSCRTIFGYKSDKRNRKQSQLAYALLTHLEWPHGELKSLPENTISAFTWEESLSVSNVLCAMRFPYAAMRYLPAEENEQSAKHKVWCLLEVAHRVSRHTGETSLLDQYRAIRGAERSDDQDRWSSEELLRAAYSLEILSAHQMAKGFAEQAMKSQWMRLQSSTTKIQEQAILIIDRCDEKLSFAETKSEIPVEQKIREALKQGDEIAAGKYLLKMTKERQPFYAFLIASPAQRPTELYGQLNELLQNGSLPDDLRSEASFYLGCLALEVGDTLSTYQALQESRRFDLNSPFEPIRQFYLHQLRSPDRK